MQKNIVLLLSGCALFLFLTMPANICPGDTYASRSESAHLINTGSLGFDYSFKSVPTGESRDIPEGNFYVGEFLDVKGEYFFENDAKQKFFSKYGIMNTIMFLPPLLAEKIFTGHIDDVDNSRGTTFFLNLHNIVLSLICIFYLYQIAGLYSDKEWLKIAFALLSVFSTYLWHYFRAHMHEIFQVVFFLIFYFHFASFLHASRNNEMKKRWGNLCLAIVALGMLFLSKVFFGVMFMAAWGFALFSGPKNYSLAERLKKNYTDHWRQLLWSLVLPTCALFSIFFLVNFYKTGSPFETGYGQEAAVNGEGVSFSLRMMSESIPGFFFQKGNANIFLHYPLLIFALFGLYRFVKKRTFDAIFIASIVTPNFLILATFPGWRGELGYGPRYLILFAIIASIPVIETIRWINDNRKQPLAISGGAALLLVCLWSFDMEVNVNSVVDWAYNYQKEIFQTFHDPDIDDYFASCWQEGEIDGDLLAYDLGKKDSYYPVEVVKKKYPEWYKENSSSFYKAIGQRAAYDYFFLQTGKQ